jgi:glycosyltransferase involved in cell wall biosynthesis
MINWLPRTCVVIPTLNAGIFLSECLESLYSTQGKRAIGLTILVLDGGSVDFTHDIVSFNQQKYGSIQLSKFPGSHPGQRITP